MAESEKQLWSERQWGQPRGTWAKRPESQTAAGGRGLGTGESSTWGPQREVTWGLVRDAPLVPTRVCWVPNRA